jgi:hypothetical protein
LVGGKIDIFKGKGLQYYARKQMRKPSRPPACNFFCVQRGAYQDSSSAAQNDSSGLEGAASIAFFLWKKVALWAPDDSRLFVEKPRPCRGLVWPIFHHKISRFTTPIKKPSFIKRAGVFI